VKQLCERAGAFASEARFDVGNYILGRQFTVARHFAELGKRLFLGLARACKGKKRKYKKDRRSHISYDVHIRHYDSISGSE
jgi:hypothetical protein